MSKTLEMIKNYVPTTPQEKGDRELIIRAEEIFSDCLHRTNLFCHYTSSAFIVNPERTKVLGVFHNIYKSWGWVGGHADGDDDMEYVAKKETAEETSLKNFKVIGSGPVSIDVLPVFSHFKRGNYVPAHTHLNVTYLIEANESEYIHIKENENSNIAWLGYEEFLEKCTEPHMLPVYKKIIERIKSENL